ncbi:hypothetical protein Tco_1405989 [Tanacetum coccineum]
MKRCNQCNGYLNPIIFKLPFHGPTILIINSLNKGYLLSARIGRAVQDMLISAQRLFVEMCTKRYVLCPRDVVRDMEDLQWVSIAGGDEIR